MKAILAVLVAAAAMPALAASDQPYTGQHGREIASLSAGDIDALLAGQGWGLAKPAELNGYPGPAHILELADELALTEAQRVAVQAVFDTMQADARVLGADYVDAEAHLSRMFRSGHANPAMLEAQLARSAELLARLRGVHLSAHLEVTPMLTEDQRSAYARLRGYGAGGGDQGGHSGHAGHGGN